MELSTNNDYIQLFQNVKQEIQEAKTRTIFAVNRSMILLYWKVGKMILERQENANWGDKIIQQLAKDIKVAYQEIEGFSYRNLKYMRTFAREYPDFEIGQPLVAQITWSHNIILLDKCKDHQKRLWYASKAIENGWSRDVLAIHIERKLFEAQGSLPNNFEKTLPKPQSDLAHQTFKDPYIFDFLNLTDEAIEREIEEAMMNHITKFLLELGQGFAFVGRQYKLDVDGEDFKVDLLFYHLKLRSYIAIDLKARKFKAEDAGKMNFYINALDDLVKTEHDNQTIGIILCKEKSNIRVEYALKNINAPIGVSQFTLTEALPKNLQTALPTIQELEQELQKIKEPKQEKENKEKQ